MIDHRQGNDLAVLWSIFKDGEPFDLRGRSLKLYLKNLHERKEVVDFSVTGNEIHWTFYGKDQDTLGKHSLILVANEDEKGMITTDACDFVRLVSCSCKLQGGEDAPNVETESIELTSTLEYVSGGGSYDDTALWKELDGKVDKVEGKELSSNDYTDEDKAKVDGLEEELATKADKSEVPTKLSQLEQDIEIRYDDTEIREELSKKLEGEVVGTTTPTEGSIGGSYDDTEIRQEIAVLSAEVGKKQATITDLENIREGASKGATAIQSVKTINGQSIVGSGNIEIQGGGGGGASSDKQGVVSQTLNYNSDDNTYSVSNVVRGAIPSFFIDLVTEAGASFNAESGYFSLNGIDNIAYDEMRQIYDCRTGYGTNSLLAVYGHTYTARTNFVAFRGYGISYSNHEPTTIYTKYLCGKNASITKFALCGEVALCVKAGSGNNFESLGLGGSPLDRSRLEEIIGVLDVTNLTGSANFFYNGAHQPWLTTFYLKQLKASIDLSGMPRLSEATILYMINNEKATAAITIKLHADAKAMADASEAIQSALENHANITLGV